MNKKELRATYLSKRKALSEGEIAQYNLQLYQQLFIQVDLSFVKVLHTYLPLDKNKEPDTWAIIDRIRREFPHIRISIPKINAQTNEIESYYFEGLHQIANNAWGIPEPQQGVPTPVDKIDVVLVPLLVFDGLGNRVGYGKGFYDRFLSQCKHDCKKIGLSFFEPIKRIDDVNQFDVTLTGCVTPRGFYWF
jgi:5-formyltetrahydrofolate cyclo-ligase